MRFSNFALLLIAILLIPVISASAQEGEAEVIDEVVVQVNESVITLSRIKREVKSIIDSLIQQGNSPSAAKASVESKMGQLIAKLINEELLLQVGKEMGLEKIVEAEVNKELVRRMSEFNLKSVDELYAAMKQQGVDPEEIRNQWRRRFMQEQVWRNRVDSVTYWKITDKEIKDYYKTHQDRFKKPPTATISELFLSFAGRDKAAVKAKAAQLVAQLRAGGDFIKLAIENSDRPNVAVDKGKVGKFILPDQLSPVFVKAIENVKVNGVTDPVELPDIGMEIIRVDERTAGSNKAFFDETMVRNAILHERRPDARKEFMETLKSDAYIKIRKTYQPMVLPHLNSESKKTAKANK